MLEIKEKFYLNSITKPNEIMDFALSFKNDRKFSDPTITDEEELRQKLAKYISDPNSYRCIGVYDGDVILGLFSFLVIKEERYLEMVIGLSREKSAYIKMLEYIREHFFEYNADFVFNPKNQPLESLLKECGAAFEAEQLKMIFNGKPTGSETNNIIPYSERYKEEYYAIHQDKELYWTAQKVITAPEKFRVFLAIKDEKVVGYIDVTHCYEENEPYYLFVSEKYRRMGLGKALLNKALEENYPKGMSLHVDKDNIPAVRLYASAGFVLDENGGCVTAHLFVNYNS